MGLIERLKAMVDATPPGSTVSLPRDWLSSQLETGEEIPAAPDNERDLTVEDIAAETGRSGSTIRGWLAEGAFPNAYKLRGREWRVSRSEFRAFLESQKKPPIVNDISERSRKVKKSDDLDSWRKFVA